MGWFRAALRRRRLEQILEDEVQRHIELQAEEYIASGMPAAQAHDAAKRRFGSVSSVKERCRDQNGTARVESFWQDLRFAARGLALQPGFTVCSPDHSRAWDRRQHSCFQRAADRTARAASHP
jgi:hypothetical protein